MHGEGPASTPSLLLDATVLDVFTCQLADTLCTRLLHRTLTPKSPATFFGRYLQNNAILGQNMCYCQNFTSDPTAPEFWGDPACSAPWTSAGIAAAAVAAVDNGASPPA